MILNKGIVFFTLLLNSLSFKFGCKANLVRRSMHLAAPKVDSVTSPKTNANPDFILKVIDQINNFEGMDDLGMSAKKNGDDESASDEEVNETKPLLADIEQLTSILGAIIRRENPEIYKSYENFKQLALDRANGDRTALGKMIEYVSSISADNALGLCRAFTQTLNLINAAEVHHRMRRLRNIDIAVLEEFMSIPKN